MKWIAAKLLAHLLTEEKKKMCVNVCCVRNVHERILNGSHSEGVFVDYILHHIHTYTIFNIFISLSVTTVFH